MQGSTNPTGSAGGDSAKKKFVIPTAEMADALMNEFGASDVNPLSGFNEWRKKAAQTSEPPAKKPNLSSSTSSSSVLTFDDSRSRTGLDGRSSSGPVVYLGSEESNHPFLRQGVEQDSKFTAGDEDPDQEVDAVALYGGVIERPDATKTTSSGQDSSSGPGQRMFTSSPQQSDWTKKRFRYMVDNTPKAGQKKRASNQVMENADEFNLDAYPQRILIAKHIRRPKWGNKPLPPGLPPFTYEFYIYKSLKHLLQDIRNTKNPNDRTLFTVAEENGPVFLYFDLEIPLARVDPKIHGSSALGLFGYCLAVAKSLLSLVLGMNVSCWSDSYMVFDSSNKEKWSAHVHIALPFRMIGGLRESMAKVKDILTKMFESGSVAALRPMFYMDKNKKGEFEWKTVVDLRVYTKKRNFRLPGNTKCEKDAHLKCANDKVPQWNRHPQMPCSVDTKNADDLVTCGLILARNSRAFWNLVTVTFQPLLKDRYGTDSKKSDFRCLPPTGTVKTIDEQLHQLYNMGDTWPDSEKKSSSLESKIASRVDAFFSVLYDENWHDMTRAVIDSDLPEHARAKSLVKNLYALFERGPRYMAIALLLVQQVYRPGAGLDQQISPGSYALNVCKVLAESIHATLFVKSSPVAAFNMVLAFHHMATMQFSKTCSDEQKTLREKFFKELGKDFTENYINKVVVQNGYTREHMRDIFVLNHLARYLLVCSGYCLHSMQVPGTAESIKVLPESPSGYQRRDLDQMYDYVFKTSCSAEGKLGAPMVAMMNQRKKRSDGTTEMFAVHRLHYSEDLLQTIARIRSTQLGSFAKSDGTELGMDKTRAMFTIVNAHNKPEFPKQE